MSCMAKSSMRNRPKKARRCRGGLALKLGDQLAVREGERLFPITEKATVLNHAASLAAAGAVAALLVACEDW